MAGTLAPFRLAPSAVPAAMKTLRIALAALVLAAAAGGLYLSTQQRDPAPAAELTLLDGSRINLASLRGKVVLVNFWATSCTTCVKEMPGLIATHQRFAPRGYETVAVAMSYDPPAYVANFVQTRKLPFKVALDHSGDAARQFGDIKLTPTTFLIGKDGQIVKRYVGEPDFAALNQLVERLLGA